MNDFRNMMETIAVPAGLDQRVLEAAEAPAAPRRSYRRIAIAALAVVLVVALGIGAYAVNKKLVGSTGYWDGNPITTLEEADAMLAQGLTGIPSDVQMPAAIGGFAFDWAFPTDVTQEFEDGTTQEVKTFGGVYTRGKAKVQLALYPVDWAFDCDGVGSTDIGDVTVYFQDKTVVRYIVRETTYVGGGVSVTDMFATNDKADLDGVPEENIISEEYIHRVVRWNADGAYYALLSDDGLTSLDELLDMAAEIINK